MRPAAKSSLYRNEVTEAAAAAVLEAISRFERGNFVPRRVAAASWQPAMHQRDRVIDSASDDTGKVLRKIWSADGSPSLKSRLCGRSLYLHDAHAAESLKGGPGEIIGRNGDAIAVATAVGAVWTGHAIRRYIADHNRHARPFVWTKTADEILEKLNRLPVPSE